LAQECLTIFVQVYLRIKWYILVLVLLPALFVAMYVGQHLHIKINDHRFNQIVNILLLVSGLSLAIKSVCLMVNSEKTGNCFRGTGYGLKIFYITLITGRFRNLMHGLF